MLNAIIVDDEVSGAKGLERLLNKYCPDVHVLALVHSIDEAEQKISTLSPDIIFLDIEMPFGSGFDLLNRLQNIRFEVIFTTAYSQYAIKAFKHNAIDYLLKPIDPDELVQAVKRCVEKKGKEIMDLKKLENLFSSVAKSAKSHKLPVHTQDGIIYFDNTEFKDYGARPLVEPSFYALGIHDTCGIDSNLSNFNETIFLQSSAGLGPNEANLNWNFYGGNSVVYYRILRDDSGKGIWHAIDSVQGAINAYTDRSAPINNGLRYMISTDWNVVCTPYLSMQFKGNRYVFSPTGSYSNMSYLYTTGIATLFNDNAVTIYPNPATNMLSVTFSESFKGAIRINNVLGQEVYSNTQFAAEKGNTGQLNISNLANGVYIITLQSNDGSSVRKKIIKE